jgi:CMP/dCMP kinase
MTAEVRIQLVDKSVATFEREAAQRLRARSPHPPRVITISRQLGSGGRKVAETLGRWMDCPVWDREILDVIASQSYLRYQARMFELLDERTQGQIDAFADSLIGNVSKHIYLHLLPRAVLIIAQNDAIILGRGAHLLLPNAFKARIVAPLDVRLRNLAQFDGLSEEVAAKRIKTSDREREDFIKELATRLGRNRSEAEYDLVVNACTFGIDGTASLILDAARQAPGFGRNRALAATAAGH